MFAVISDIHGNFAALRSALQFLDARGIHSIFCLGDIVGYGPHPAECISALRERGIPCLRGNHEEGTLDPSLLDGFSADAARGIRYSRAELTTNDLAFLRSLRSTLVSPEYAFVHASFPDPFSFDYLLEPEDAEGHLRTQPAPVSFFGHTHRPGIFELQRPGATGLASTTGYRLGAHVATALNPGSIGQPRDGDPRASLLLCDQRSGMVEFCRVAYDIDETIHAIAQVGLPRRLAERLRRGR